MDEVFDIRLFEAEASNYLPADVGERLGSGLARRVVVRRDDAVFRLIDRAEASLRAEGRTLVASWDVVRTYTDGELASSAVLMLLPSAAFEPAGEQCGTLYDDNGACEHCGVGGLQVGPLHIDPARVPRKATIAWSIAHEVVIRTWLVDSLEAGKASGVRFDEVRACSQEAAVSDWRQLVVTGEAIGPGPSTLFGTSPFAPHQYRDRLGCSHGAGPNILSELSIRARHDDAADFARLDHWLGIRGGLVRPWQPMLISQRTYQMLHQSQAGGYRVEAVRLE